MLSFEKIFKVALNMKLFNNYVDQTWMEWMAPSNVKIETPKNPGRHKSIAGFMN